MIRKNLTAEARRMTKLLKGKVVTVCRRYRSEEVLIEFECGTRLFVNAKGEVEISITGCEERAAVTRGKVGR